MCERNSNGTYAIGHLGLKGKANGHWKGNLVGYFGLHEWLYKYYGKADRCDKNLNHIERGYEWCNLSGKYLRKRSDWIRLCRSCHRIMDKGNFCKNGHEFTKQNTWIRKNGWRVCRECSRQRSLKYRNKIKEGGDDLSANSYLG